MSAPQKRTVFTIRGRAAAGLLPIAVALALAACSSSSPVASPSGSGAATRPATIAPATTRASAPGTTATLVPMQTVNGGEFLSPSGNISCEIDYDYHGITGAYCQTSTPPQSVHMGVTGSYTTCTGDQCLGNPGVNTSTLAYGEVTGVGPFRCLSAATGFTCTAGGRGFRISTSGITPA